MSSQQTASDPSPATSPATHDLAAEALLEIQAEVQGASSAWIDAFNRRDVDTCVGGYTEDAEMRAAPFGVFQGAAAIDGFWRPFVGSGAGELVYSNVEIKVIDAATAVLSADWRMNVGRGIITEERWEKQASGAWRLTFDAFEVQEKFE